MRHTIIVVLMLSLVVSVVAAQAPTQGQNAGPRGSAENGKKLFVSIGCYECHGFAAHGPGGDSLLGGPRIAPHPIAFPAFSKYLRQPKGQMPPYTQKIASDQDVADIYAWLLTIPDPPAVSSIPELKN
jgi:ubiquinol-cytochrome c reductase cytochrome c subunit